MIYITLSLLIVGVSAYACMAVLEFRYSRSVFSKLGNDRFWNPYQSNSNKWKHDEHGLIEIRKGRRVERFPGSSTIFVFVTDAWHMMQFFFLNSVILSIAINTAEIKWYWSFLIIRVLYSIVFNSLFDRLLLKK